ncbi:MAG: hypothetical protein QOF14_4201 [Hyphomicrobiales bacterium]|jgi:hypothetical protein|nr:hypothetical protein [Hyphomicrobiales bacterium]
MATRICVQKFNDLNGNGVREPGEPTLTGFTFTIKNNAGQVVGQIKSEGCIDVQPGTYTVEEQIQAGWTPTTPNPRKVTVALNQTVNVLVGNRKAADQNCCQFGLMLFNTLVNTVKKVVIVPATPAAIIDVYNDEAPDFTLTHSANQYIITSVASAANPGGFFPANASQVLELDFAIRVVPSMAPTSVTVRWLNASGQVIKEELVKLECEKNVGDENTDYDWYSKRSRVTGLADNVMFSGAEPEECDSFDDDERMGACGFDPYQIVCVGGQRILKRTASNSNSSSSYTWSIDDNGVLTAYSAAAFSHTLTPGLHAITMKLTVTDASGPVDCQEDLIVCIPNPGFTIGTPQLQCSPPNQGKYKVEFTPSDPSSCNTGIATYQWVFGDSTTQSGTGIPGPIVHYYAGPGPYTVQLKLVDKPAVGGCAYTVQHVVATFDTTCNPRFRIEYELCPTTMKGPIPVKFFNDSQAFCNPTFEWDFGEPSSSSNLVSTSSTAMQTHGYTYDGTLPPQNFTVKLTMKDDPCKGTATSPKVTFSVPFTLKPVPLTVKVLVCPDGETHFVANTTGKVIWDLSASNLSAAWVWCKAKMLAVNAVNAALGQHNGFKCHLPNGTYLVNVTAEDTSQPNVKATCKLTREFVVARTCCEKFWEKDHKNITQNSKDYRMKFKHAVTNPILWIGTHIVGKTKFKVKKTVKNTSWTYFKRIKADTISVNVSDNLRMAGPHPADPSVTCKTCIAPVLLSNGTQESDKSKAKYSTSVSTRGVDKADDLTSLHYVKHKAGWEWWIKVQKLAGNDCTQSTITCQPPGASQFGPC